ncbi:MAG: dephospho-CoA kinase [Bacteroidia bacterium]
MIYNIGITGGIGSGKSTVCRIFASMGYRVYEADARAKALMNEDEALRAAIQDLLGREAYDADGQLDRAYVGRQVFGQPDRLQRLNAIVHPATARDYHRWIGETPADYDRAFVLKEAAILFESGADRGTDGTIAVYAPETLRLARAMHRDGTDAEAIRARMHRQWPEQDKLRRADFVIYSDMQHPLVPQVLAAIRFFGARAAARSAHAST